MERGGLSNLNWRELAVLYAAWLGMFYYVTVSAWVAEDTYITFRVLDNFMQGYGLRWNIVERVQAYTHPLWLLLHIPFYALSGNLFLTNIVLSIFCTMAALLVIVASSRQPIAVALFGFFLPLFCSKSFMDYSTSGLENPLSYLLFACFGYVLLRRAHDQKFWLYASLTTALALTNRLDTFLFYAPPLFYLAYINPSSLRWRQVALGFSPLITWFAFSFFYYGFLFPNTKYAKLDTGLGFVLYVSQGIHYLKFLLVKDVAGTLILLSSGFFLLKRSGLPLAIAIGVALYTLYVICIGGDYMAGRFWALPIFIAAWLWFNFFPLPLRSDFLIATAGILVAAFFIPQMVDKIRKNCTGCIKLEGRVIDAHNTFHSNSFIPNLHPLHINSEGHYFFAKEGQELSQQADIPPKSLYYIGMTAYYAGPHITFIDMLGLADPLLARLPAIPTQNFYIGHFRRAIPKGYPYALETNSLERMQPDLAQYYAKLRLITSGDLLDMERLQTIIAFNLGLYDHWKRDYLNQSH